MSGVWVLSRSKILKRCEQFVWCLAAISCFLLGKWSMGIISLALLIIVFFLTIKWRSPRVNQLILRHDQWFFINEAGEVMGPLQLEGSSYQWPACIQLVARPIKSFSMGASHRKRFAFAVHSRVRASIFIDQLDPSDWQRLCQTYFIIKRTLSTQ